MEIDRDDESVKTRWNDGKKERKDTKGKQITIAMGNTNFHLKFLSGTILFSSNVNLVTWRRKRSMRENITVASSVAFSGNIQTSVEGILRNWSKVSGAWVIKRN